MFPLLQIGPLALPVDGLLLIAGAWLGLELAERTARLHYEHTLRPDVIYGLAFAAIFAGAPRCKTVVRGPLHRKLSGRSTHHH